VAAGEDVVIARLRPAPELGVDGLLAMSLGLDVWERGPDHVVAALPAAVLGELERRRLATVESLGSREQYLARMRDEPPTP
jgi:hypothetical protein